MNKILLLFNNTSRTKEAADIGEAIMIIFNSTIFKEVGRP